MKLVTFNVGGRIGVGVLVGDKIVDLNAACKAFLAEKGKKASADELAPSSMLEFIEGGEKSMELAAEAINFTKSHDLDLSFERANCKLEAPIRPGKIICVAINNPRALEATISERPSKPLIFLKPPSTIIGNGDKIVLPPITKAVYPEWEVALVVGKRAKNVKGEKAYDIIAGYTCLNDVTAGEAITEDIWVHGYTNPERLAGVPPRRRETTFGLFRAKGHDTFGPMGPCLVTKDEIDPNDVEMELRVNGDVVQEGNTKEWVFKIPDVVEFVTDVLTLEPGDIISMGQCGPGRVLLKRGDKILGSAKGIGILENVVV